MPLKQSQIKELKNMYMLTEIFHPTWKANHQGLITDTINTMYKSNTDFKERQAMLSLQLSFSECLANT